MAKNLNKAMGTFQDMDNNFFKIMDPEKNSMQEPKPNALYAATRSFVIDSGASYHLIGYNQLTEKRKGFHPPNQRTVQNSERQWHHHRGQRGAHFRSCSERVCLGPTDARLPSCLVLRDTMFKTGLDLRVAERQKSDVIEGFEEDHSDASSRCSHGIRSSHRASGDRPRRRQTGREFSCSRFQRRETFSDRGRRAYFGLHTRRETFCFIR